jgi:rfaE bifunctional protein kinase chain/domain
VRIYKSRIQAVDLKIETCHSFMNPEDIFQKFKNQHVVIIGDVMIDRYLRGTVSRISPEAPVPVVLHQSTEDRLGGAANVALNVQALGGVPLLCSVVGDDVDGRNLTGEILPAFGISATGILRSDSRRTTVKTRVLGNTQQMLRIDSEDTHDLSAEDSRLLLQTLANLLSRHPVSAIILQDYNKGVLTADVIAAVISLSKEKGVFTAVDPKKANFFAYSGVDLFKPNLKEVRESTPFPVSANLDSLENAADYLQDKLKNRYTMLTLSEKGLYLKGDSKGVLYPTTPRNISDVSGAGDTVISIATMGLAAGLDLDTVALLSNLAGGQVCETSGVVPVRLDLLEQEILGV